MGHGIIRLGLLFYYQPKDISFGANEEKRLINYCINHVTFQFLENIFSFKTISPGLIKLSDINMNNISQIFKISNRFGKMRFAIL